jgi:hypothetical protein
MMIGYVFGKYDKDEKYIGLLLHHSLLFRVIFTISLILVLGCVTIAIEQNDKTISISELAKFVVSGLVLISLFYSILAFEFNVQKNREDKRVQKSMSTYNAISDWQKSPLVDYTKTIRAFENGEHKGKLRGSMKELDEFLDGAEQADLKKAIVSTINYFEVLAGGIGENIMDEEFTRRYFKTIFTLYYKDWIQWITHRRTTEDSEHLWTDFTNLVEKWNREISKKSQA